MKCLSRSLGDDVLMKCNPGNGLLPNGTKPSPRPVLTYHHYDLLEYISIHINVAILIIQINFNMFIKYFLLWWLHSPGFSELITCTVETLYSKIYYNKYFIELHIDKSTQYVAL